MMIQQWLEFLPDKTLPLKRWCHTISGTRLSINFLLTNLLKQECENDRLTESERENPDRSEHEIWQQLKQTTVRMLRWALLSISWVLILGGISGWAQVPCSIPLKFNWMTCFTGVTVLPECPEDNHHKTVSIYLCTLSLKSFTNH